MDLNYHHLNVNEDEENEILDEFQCPQDSHFLKFERHLRDIERQKDIYLAILHGKFWELKDIIKKSTYNKKQIRKLLELKDITINTPTGVEVAPALLIASKYGHLKIVHYLLKEFNVNVDAQGTVQFDGFQIEGATALWCASGKGHLDIVQALVENNAKVNLTTLSNSTPLRAACFDGHLDIVRYLVDHGGDITIPNRYLNNCLMISVYRGHLPVVMFLLEKGMDPNAKASSNATALQFAAETGRADLCRVLVEYGATLSENDLGLDQVFVAAENAQTHAVLYLISEPRLNVSRTKMVDALELLGAMLLNDKDRYDPVAAFRPLKQAMQIRCSLEPALSKKEIVPCAAYGYNREPRTMAELEEVQYEFETLSLQGLMARERILGRGYKDLPGPIVYRGAVYADQLQFGRCLDLWMHALELRIEQRAASGKDLLRLAQVLSQMLSLQLQPPLTVVLRVIELCTEEIGRAFVRLSDAQAASRATVPMVESCNQDMHTVIYLLAILCKVQMNRDQEPEAFALVHKLVKKEFRKPGQLVSLLHLACDSSTVVDSFHIDSVVKLPSSPIVHLLLLCGADPNARDFRGDTPLHSVCRHDRALSDVISVQSILSALLRYGAHPDLRNGVGHLPGEVASSNVVPLMYQFALRSSGRETLRCRAIQAVLKYQLPLNDLPADVVSMVKLHSPALRAV